MNVVEYKEFVNSKDFERIFRESLPEIIKHNEDYAQFYVDYVLPAKYTGHLLLLYKEEKVIGYHLIKIANREVLGGFTYVSSDFRQKGGANLLREAMFQKIKNDIDKVKAVVYHKNASSLISCKKLAQKMKMNIVKESPIIDGRNVEVGTEYTVKIPKKFITCGVCYGRGEITEYEDSSLCPDCDGEGGFRV